MISRKTLKRHMPNVAKRGLESLRDRLNGPGIEADVLNDITFAPETSDRPRLTVLIPNLQASTAFGGVLTGLTLAADLRARLAPHGIDFRIVSEASIDPADCVLDKLPGLADADTATLDETGGVLPMRAGDICLVYNWWISINLAPALAAQAAHFGQPPRPRIHLIQEYEPQFYPFSAANLLAHQAVGFGDALWGVFNTNELFDYWQRQGHEAAKTFMFEPRMNTALRPFVDGLTVDEKTRTMLVYGRPNIPRNAFFLVERGLKAWGAAHGADHGDWRIVSAGTAHDDIDLGGGQALRSVGKLSLENYAKLLRETAVGLSLMVSPHPSYPPLEMAHFGVRVLTNGYTGKTPSARHDNLIALEDFHPTGMAAAIEAAIQGFEADPAVGLTATSRMPHFLEPEDIECAGDLAEAILAEMTPQGAS